MKRETPSPVLIRARDAGRVSAWKLPDMTDDERDRLIALAQKPEPEPITEVKVVEEEVYAEKLTLAQWEAIVEEARAEGLEQGREEGLEAGRKEGFEQGLQQGLEEGQAKIDAQLQRLEALIGALQRPLEEQHQALEATILTLVEQLAGAVVQAELASRPELLTAAIAQALDCLPPNPGPVRLRLNPEDSALLETQAELQGWELIEDPAMTAGGCELLAGASRVDVSVESRFAQVADQLKRRLLPAAADELPDGGGEADPK
ncbi:flagellar assembly protein FliH [Marinobacterium mangrovicola]|uniref:Flagellar assembly protein FliH n=1 Tax=Marinobacterium mangrovicola TaxID=1476959 RepID=A0A4R1GLR1_9GAMM|nr:flagellar assembly protein FliH [Marinobacterium mangrovicola]TCK07069.1 flagellar assembly protein FliH [Marinobacterium mangrovicola]